MTTPRASNADHIRWQQQALKAMTDVINKGAKAALPILTWQLGQSGCLGRVSTLGLTVEEQEAVLRAWADLLGWAVAARGAYRRAEEPVKESWMSPRVALSVELYDWEVGSGE